MLEHLHGSDHLHRMSKSIAEVVCTEAILLDVQVSSKRCAANVEWMAAACHHVVEDTAE